MSVGTGAGARALSEGVLIPAREHAMLIPARDKVCGARVRIIASRMLQDFWQDGPC
jgi:hypothetical protein